ncbi:MAG: hypothetical protein WEC79_06930 [Thermomicrobiales bacterium]
MNSTQPVVAIVDGSSYVDRISGVLSRDGFALTTIESAKSAAGGLSRALDNQTPHAIIYCVRDEHPSVDLVRRTCERFVRLQPPARVIVCSGDFQFVQSLRSANLDDDIVVLYEPFDVEMLLEAIRTPSQSNARTRREYF